MPNARSAVLVLASASPRRRALLEEIGARFETLAVNIDERPRPQENAAVYTRRLAREKARKALVARPDAWILAADTVVEIDGLILGKPSDAAAARSMLSRLAGRTHRVLTAVALVTAEDGVHMEQVVESHVRFRPLSARDIDDYVATGEPFDKAGGYAVQGLGGQLIEGVEGSYSSVVGLPLEVVREALATRGLLP